MRMASLVMTTLLLGIPGAGPIRGAESAESLVRKAVDATIRPLMIEQHIPGMAVGLLVNGRIYVFNYGVASRETGQPVTDRTLFELGSVTKTFTATLASWTQEQGAISLSDPVAKYLPELKGTAFGAASLLNLGTHTPGGLPLQVPENIHNNDQLMAYLQAWKPVQAPGTLRTYSNPSIGTLGLILARNAGQDFATLLEQRLFPALGLKNSFVRIPADRMADYAQGYTKDGAPIRMAPGVLAEEAYGMRSTAGDLVRFVEANLGQVSLEAKLQSAITKTHTGYFRVGGMIQDLIWEQYPWPSALKPLLEGNSAAMALNPTPVEALQPPLKPQADAWLNKTGSTNGFGAYVAFIPSKGLGIVMLANHYYPNEARVSAAYSMLRALAPSTF